jgi:hypothetical protein
MKIKITYQVNSGEIREKVVIRDTVAAALRWFKWRYGHDVIAVD